MVQTIREIVLKSLLEIGIDLQEELNEEKNDIDLREYMTDSIEFITFIVALEENIGTELPDSIIRYDSLCSFNGFCMMLENDEDVKYI